MNIITILIITIIDNHDLAIIRLHLSVIDKYNQLIYSANYLVRGSEQVSMDKS
jgi:hypothetical protein